MKYEYRTRFIAGTTYEIEAKVDQAIVELAKGSWEALNVSVSTAMGRADFAQSVLAAVLFRRAGPVLAPTPPA